MKNVKFEDYYDLVKTELKKGNKRGNNYFDTLGMLVNVIMLNSTNDYDKILKLRRLCYSNGSLTEKQIEKIDKELGYEE